MFRFFSILAAALAFPGIGQAAEPEKIAPLRLEQIAVIGLPERPPNNVFALLNIFMPVDGRQSRLIQAQTELWLQRLSVAELQAMRQALIDGGWNAAFFNHLRTAFENALASHPDRPVRSNDPVTAVEAGRRAGRVDGKQAIEDARKIDNEEAQYLFLYGVEQSAGHAGSYENFLTLRETIRDLIRGNRYEPPENRNPFSGSWWPVESLVTRILDRPEEKRNSGDHDLIDRAAWYFSDLQEAFAYAGRLGRYEPNTREAIAREMAPALASRGAEGTRFPIPPRFSGPLEFDPARDEPQAFGDKLLRLDKSPERQAALYTFANRWARHDGPAAIAWASGISEENGRDFLLRFMMHDLAEWDEKAARQALAAIAKMETATRRELEETIHWQSEKRRNAVMRKIEPTFLNMDSYRVQVRFVPAPDAQLVTRRPGGPTDAATIKTLRATLAQLARPGEPPISDAALGAEILALGDDTVSALLADFVARRPVTPRENDLRFLLWERWALVAPTAAAEWILEHGSGFARSVLPFALGQLALTDTQAALRLRERIPDKDLRGAASTAIFYNTITRSYEEACDLGCIPAVSSPVQEWKGAEPEAARRWMQKYWLEE